MKPKPPTRQQGQKARVMYACSSDDMCSTLVIQPKQYGPLLDTVLAVIPCSSLREARARVKFERLSWEGKRTKIAETVFQHAEGVLEWDKCEDCTEAILSLLGHAKPQ